MNTQSFILSKCRKEFMHQTRAERCVFGFRVEQSSISGANLAKKTYFYWVPRFAVLCFKIQVSVYYVLPSWCYIVLYSFDHSEKITVQSNNISFVVDYFPEVFFVNCISWRFCW